MTRVSVLQARGDIPGAIGELNRLLDRAPNDVPARKLLARLNYAEGDLEAALATLDKAIERNPTLHVWYELKGDFYFDQLTQTRRTPNPSPQRLAELRSRVLESYGKAVELEAVPAMINKLVLVHFSLDPPEHEAALKLLASHRAPLEADPALRCNYARALHATGDHAKAVEELRTAFRQYKSDANDDRIEFWYRTLQRVFRGRPPQEMEAVVMELTNQRPDATDLKWLARNWAAEGAEGLSRALELQRRAVSQHAGRDPVTEIDLHYFLAAYLIEDGQFQAAADALARILQIDPDELRALNDYAYLLAAKLDRPQDALTHARKLAGMLSSRLPAGLRASFLDTIGWVHFQAAQAGEAETYLRQSVEAQESATNLLHLATVLTGNGKPDLAETYLERAAELRPDPATRAEIDALADDIRTKRDRQ